LIYVCPFGTGVGRSGSELVAQGKLAASGRAAQFASVDSFSLTRTV